MNNSSNPNPIEDALSKLDTTINSINGKVQAETQKTKNYNETIEQKLLEILNQIETLKNNMPNISGLKQELANTKAQLSNIGQDLMKKQTEIDTKTKELNDAINRINGLTQENEKQKQNIAAQQNSIEVLNKTLAGLNAERNTLASKIININDKLNSQIGTISQIVSNLDINDNGVINTKFQNVQQKIKEVMDLMGKQNGGNKKKYSNNTMRTKRKNSKTKKFRNGYKFRGGYIYKTNKELEKSSSVISGSSSNTDINSYNINDANTYKKSVSRSKHKTKHKSKH